MAHVPVSEQDDDTERYHVELLSCCAYDRACGLCEEVYDSGVTCSGILNGCDAVFFSDDGVPCSKRQTPLSPSKYNPVKRGGHI